MDYIERGIDSISNLSRVKKFQVLLWVVAIFVMLSMEQDIFLLADKAPEDRSTKIKKNTTQLYIPTKAPISHETPASNKSSRPPTLSPTIETPARAANVSQPPSESSTTIATTAPEVNDTIISTPAPNASIPSLTPAPTAEPTVSATIKKPTASSITSPPPHIPTAPSNFTIRTAPDILQGKSIDELPEDAQTFLQEHCNLQNVKEWYPTGDAAWKQRAPYVILAGVWNAGVGSVQHALRQHPQVTSVGLPDFFLPRTFYRYQVSKMAQVFAARERMYAQVYPKFSSSTQHATGESENSASGADTAASPSSSTIAVDVSPGYLFHAAQTSTSIQCVSPWSKTVVLLRDPVDRVYRQWVYGREKLGLRLSLEDWIAQELKAMQSVGLLTLDGGDNDKKGPPRYRRRLASREEEREAWKLYQSKRNLSGVIGRSLYVLQLEEWFTTLRSVGKDPSKEVFLMRSEVWEDQPQQEYQQLLDFLGLSPYIPTTFLSPKSPDPTDLPMKPETKKLLEDFFKPYNRRLAKMLQENGLNQDLDWNEPLWV